VRGAQGNSRPYRNLVTDGNDPTLLTLNVTLLRDFVATQHGQRAAILTRKCSVSYSITSSAMASNLPHFEPE